MRRGGQWLTDGEGREVLGGRLTMEAGVNAAGGWKLGDGCEKADGRTRDEEGGRGRWNLGDEEW